jgi:hypothetical protein
MPTMVKRKKNDLVISNATLTQAFEDWMSNDAYVSGNNYRLKSTCKIAPWNKQVRQWFHSNEHFSRAARHYKATGQAIVPAYVVYENVRITNYPDKIKVEVADRKSRYSGTLGYDWSSPRQVWGWAAKALFTAVAVADDHPMLRMNWKDVED